MENKIRCVKSPVCTRTYAQLSQIFLCPTFCNLVIISFCVRRKISNVMSIINSYILSCVAIIPSFLHVYRYLFLMSCLFPHTVSCETGSFVYYSAIVFLYQAPFKRSLLSSLRTLKSQKKHTFPTILRRTNNRFLYWFCVTCFLRAYQLIKI